MGVFNTQLLTTTLIVPFLLLVTIAVLEVLMGKNSNKAVDAIAVNEL